MKDLGGGQVNTATGDFVFGMTEAYLIEDGKITEPIREGNLIGNGPDVLTKIDAVGNDFAMGHPGMCGKDGQGVPVGDASHPPGHRAHHRRNGWGLAMAGAELHDSRVGARSSVRRRAGRGRRRAIAGTEIRVYEGEVEKLTTAESAGSVCGSSATTAARASTRAR